MLIEDNKPEGGSVAPAQHEAAALRTDELDYDLPARLIATRPVEPRDAARMLVTWRTDERIEHRAVRDLPEFLAPDDVLVFNTTSVAPARLVGRRRATGGQVEGLFIQDVGNAPLRWRVMLKAGGRLRLGDQIDLLDHRDQPGLCTLLLVAREGDQWVVEPRGIESTDDALDLIGRTPLPPYIRQARGDGAAVADEDDRRWYQTIYADDRQRRSVAAPTAGLHFTPPLLGALAAKGVQRAEVTLHVGLGTFKPVTAPTLGEHRMHAESFEIPPAALDALRARLGRIIAVGSTSVRALESLPQPGQMCGRIAGMTDLLIAPPYAFKHVDGMLTNFHLPRSTLLALVAAMVGLPRLKAIYREAIEREYRFYSYGDAMLILP